MKKIISFILILCFLIPYENVAHAKEDYEFGTMVEYRGYENRRV